MLALSWIADAGVAGIWPVVSSEVWRVGWLAARGQGP
jgi:hypothetical protein